MHTTSYIVSAFLLFMLQVYATPNSGPTLLPEHPSPVASTNVLDFIAVYEGSYSTSGQVASEKNKAGQHHILLDAYSIPVDIPAFSKAQKIILLIGEEVNGAVYRKELLELVEEENEVIRVKRYNLTGNPAYNNMPLEELQPEELETNPDCDALAVKVESSVFVMSFPDCRLNREGQSYPPYVAVLTCSSIILYTPAHAVETPNTLPYILKKTDTFPLPEYLFQDKYSDYTYDFVNPC